MRFNDNDKKYIIKRVIVFLIISFISFFIFHGCVNASVVSRYMCNESGGSNSCDDTFQSSDTFTELPLYYMGDNRPFFANGGQGYINFSFIAWGYSGTYNLPIYSVDITSDLNPSTGNQSLFSCDIGTYSQYYDNNNNYVVYSVKCPVQIGSLGLHGIRIYKYSGSETLLIKRGSILTFTSDVDISSAISQNANQIAQQQIQNSNTNTQSIISALNLGDGYTQQAINNAANQAHQDSQAIHNSITSTDTDEESASCGIICKLKYIVSFLKPSNLIHLIVPTQQDWQDCINNAVLSFRNNMGVLGLVMSIFFDCFQVLLGTYIPNYCFTWQDIHVPNFESLTPIIQSGQFCLDQYFQTGILKTFRDTLMTIIGGLIVFAFIQYCLKAVKRILNVQLTGEDEYEYITTTNSYDKMLSDGSMFHTTTRHNYRKRAS